MTPGADLDVETTDPVAYQKALLAAAVLLGVVLVALLVALLLASPWLIATSPGYPNGV